MYIGLLGGGNLIRVPADRRPKSVECWGGPASCPGLLEERSREWAVRGLSVMEAGKGATYRLPRKSCSATRFWQFQLLVYCKCI
jgi:hypothetical protein